jgi:hypothetical protein
MMWINRAYLLEKEALETNLNREQLLDKVNHIADAFRASLQVTKEPSAVIGLAANGLLGLETARGELAAGFSQWDVDRHSDEYATVATSNGVSNTIKEVAKGRDSMPNSNRTSRCSTNISQDLLLEPHRAELWLKLAKHLASLRQGSRRKESAHAAASKAMLILTSQLSEPSQRHEQQVEEDYVDANILSESLVLVSGTENLISDAYSKSNQSKDLQCALLTAPWNRLARQALSG